MPHTFFFSYARADQDPWLKRFYDDLRREVASRGGFDEDSVGFRDSGVVTGANWVRDIAGAVGACSVFVPVYSPAYFSREFTGQEWHAFSSRLSEHETATGHRPDAILPVWWLPPRHRLPAVAVPVQHAADEFGTDHQLRGLRYLMQRKSTRDAYYEFLVKFAHRILDAADDPPSPQEFADLSQLPNAFASDDDDDETRQPLDATGAPAAGPRHVTFLLAAAGRDAMRPLRADLEVYGKDWADWRPYHPACSDRIVVRAQHEVTTNDQDMTTEAAVITEALAGMLERAKERNELVIVVIDPWAVHLPQYERLLTRFDEIRSAHVAVLVPWEAAGTQPSQRQAALRDKLHAVLGEWTDAGDHAFRDDLASMTMFVESLQQVVVAVRARVVNRAAVKRRAAEAGPTLRPSLAPFGG